MGGFVTPFLVLGSTLFLSAVMTAFVLPEHPNRRNDVTSDGNIIYMFIFIMFKLNFFYRSFVYELYILFMPLQCK